MGRPNTSTIHGPRENTFKFKDGPANTKNGAKNVPPTRTNNGGVGKPIFTPAQIRSIKASPAGKLPKFMTSRMA